MDIVTISGLQVATVIGIHAWERQVPQVLLIDLEMASDITVAAASDDIADALDYSAVSERLLAFAAASDFRLLETMAEQMAQLLQREFALPWLRLRLGKPGAVAQAISVGIVVERGSR
jgi:dihydroneopterin aldolase